MKKFLLGILGFTCFFLAILTVFVGCLVKYSKDRHIYLDEYGKKMQMMSDTSSPRIIFLGGSNLAFGIDSKSVADTFGVNVVNYGLQAGVGLRLMMLDAAEYCRKGDILVISPEYEHFFGNAHGEKTTLSVLTLLYPKVVGHFDARNFYVSFSGLKNAVSVMSGSLMNEMSDGGNVGYQYSSLSFNDFGDESRHWTYPSEGLTLEPNSLDDGFDDTYFSQFVASVSALQSDGIEVVIVPPSIYSEFYERHHHDIDLLAGKLAEARMPFAIAPEKMVFPRDEMFDSYYHLSKNGVDKRMALITDALRQVPGLVDKGECSGQYAICRP